MRGLWWKANSVDQGWPNFLTRGPQSEVKFVFVPHYSDHHKKDLHFESISDFLIVEPQNEVMSKKEGGLHLEFVSDFCI